MAKGRLTVDLVEASRSRFVLDTELGRIIVESDSIRFHKNGKGRGVVLLDRKTVE
jgi:hypothetical protein